MNEPSVAGADHPIAAAYRGVRTRVTALLADQPDEVLERPVAACPGWRVRDVVAHQVGSAEDILAGDLDDAASDAWTQAQVDRHRDEPFADLLATWDELGPQIEALAPHVPPRPAAQMIFDVATHEADLRGALGQPGGRDSDAVTIGLDFLLRSLGKVVERQGLPTLVVDLGDEQRMLGEGDPAATVRLDRFEAFRAFGGRRSLSQIRAYAWDGDPAPLGPLFTGDVLTAPATDLVE